jgi:hypothetical protein
MALDAFGRLRTSDNFTTFNYYPSEMTSNTNLDIDVWVSNQTGGAQTYNSYNYINMPISGSGVTYSLRTTKQPMIYQPGKSRLIFMTGVLMTTVPPPSGTAFSHMGIFTVDNPSPTPPSNPVISQGTYLSTNGINLYWEDKIQNVNPSNSVVQSSWNIDTFNGSGPSGKTLTVANAAENLLIVIDQEWLGVGRIRCGFIIDGVIYYAHQFLHNNMTYQYTNTPRLNLSYYIVGNSVNSMRQMCSTHIIEGGYFTTGRLNSVNTPLSNFVTLNSTNNFVLLALKIQSSFPVSTFFIKGISLYYTGGSGRYAQYTIQLFSTNGSIGALTGAAPSFSSLSNSSIEYYIGNGTVYVSTSGIIIGSGYVDSSSNISGSLSEFDSLQTHQLFTKYDTLIITGIASSGGTPGTMGASVNFIEDI